MLWGEGTLRWSQTGLEPLWVRRFCAYVWVCAVVAIKTSLSLSVLICQVGSSHLLCPSPGACRGLKGVTRNVRAPGPQSGDVVQAVAPLPEKLSAKPGPVCRPQDYFTSL